MGWELTVTSQKWDLEVKWLVLQNCHIKSRTKILRIENKIKAIITTLYKSIVRLHLEYSVQYQPPQLRKNRVKPKKVDRQGGKDGHHDKMDSRNMTGTQQAGKDMTSAGAGWYMSRSWPVQKLVLQHHDRNRYTSTSEEMVDFQYENGNETEVLKWVPCWAATSES